MSGKDKTNISPYEAVFGMPYHDSITSTLEEASGCNTVEERLTLMPDPSFRKLAELTCELRDEDDAYDEEVEKQKASPWDPDSDEEDNVTMDQDKIPESDEEDSSKKAQEKNIAPPLNNTPLKDVLVGAFKGRKNAKQNKDFTYLRKFGVQDAFSSGKATVVTRNDDKKYGFIYPRLECDCCLTGEHLLSIGNEEYLKSCGKGTKKWYESDFIGTFATLLAHCRHKTDTPSDVQLVHISHPNTTVTKKEMKTMKSGIKKLVACLYASSHFAVMEISLGCEDVLIFDGLSYPLDCWIPHVKNLLARCSLLDGEPEEVTVKVEKENAAVRVTSGKKSWLVKSAPFMKQQNWYDCGPIACVKLMETFGLLELDDQYDYEASEGLRQHVVDCFKTLLKYSVNDIFVSPPVIELSDDDVDDDDKVVSQCCVCIESISSHQGTVMECCGKRMHAVCVSNWLENHPSCPLCRETVKSITFQGEVIPFWPQVLDERGSKGQVIPWKPQLLDERDDENASSNGLKNINMEMEGEAEKNKNDTEHPVTPEMEGRLESRLDNIKKASAIKRARQDNQAEKMKLRRAKYAKDSGAAIGAVVKICNDKRDTKNPRCSIGVVLETGGAGGILVMTDHGLLVSGKKRTPYWVPSDNYEVIASAGDKHAGLGISQELERIRAAILDGKFDKSTASTCTLNEEQKRFLGASPVRAGPGCKCKVNGDKTCSRSCSCIKNKRACTSKCLCNGNCLANEHNH